IHPHGFHARQPLADFWSLVAMIEQQHLVIGVPGMLQQGFHAALYLRQASLDHDQDAHRAQRRMPVVQLITPRKTTAHSGLLITASLQMTLDHRSLLQTIPQREGVTGQKRLTDMADASQAMALDQA